MSNPREEQTFLMVKPDGVKRGLVGEVLSRIERRGLKIVALKMIYPTHDEIDNHYPKEPSWVNRLGEKTLSTYAKYNINAIDELGTERKEEIGPMVRNWLVDFMSSGPVVIAVVRGVHAVDMIRKLVGQTMPYLAEMGTIRGDYSVDSPLLANKEKRSVHNLVHASETPEEAEHEMRHWFGGDTIHEYKRTDEELQY